MERPSADGLKQGYFGRVIDIFTCVDPITQTSLPNLLGKYLFYHIVDEPQTATTILSAFNKAKLPGEVNFFSLSILDSFDCGKSDEIAQLSFDAKFQKIFEKIFSEKPVNRSELEHISEISFVTNRKMSTATSDSGFSDENGALIGVEASPDCNALELYQQQQQLTDMDEAARYDLIENSYRLDETHEMLNQQHQTISQIQQVNASVAETTHAIHLREMRIRALQLELQKHEAKLRSLIESMERYEKEMSSSLLIEHEMVEIQSVQNRIIVKKQQLEQVTAKIKDSQMKHDNISECFKQTVMNPYNALNAQLEQHSSNLIELNRKLQMLSDCENIKQQIDRQWAENHGKIIEFQEQQKLKSVAITQLKRKRIEIEGMQKFLLIELNTMKTHQQNMGSELNRLVGQKPYDATEIHNPDLVDMSEKDIDSNLCMARHQLKTYENTNSFDFNLLEIFKKDQQNLIKRRNEHTTMGNKIKMCMKRTEARVMTTFQDSFDDLARKFTMNFMLFVPTGSGRLELIDAMSGNANTLNAGGVRIIARFDQTDEEHFENLLGPEQRVVALVFIISMQQLCQSPFYLFDGIDEVINFNVCIKI